MNSINKYIFFFSITLIMLGHGIIIPIISNNNVNPMIAGLIVSVYSLGTFISAPFTGNYVNKNGSKQTLQISIFLYILLLIIIFNIHNILIILVLRFFSGVLMSAVFSSVETYISKYNNSYEQSQNFLLTSIANSLGMTIGPFLGIYFTTKYKNNILLGLFLFSLVLILLIHFFIYEKKYTHANNDYFNLSFKEISINLQHVYINNKKLFYSLICFSLFGFIVSSFETFGLKFIRDNYSISQFFNASNSFSIPLFIEAFLLILIAILYLFKFNPLIINRFGSYNIILLSGFISAISQLLIFLVLPPYLFIFNIIIMVVSLAIYSNAIIVNISQISDNKGLFLGLKNSTMAIGSVIGPLLGGVISIFSDKNFLLLNCFFLISFTIIGSYINKLHS